MKFHHEFTVPLDIDGAWRMVGDAEKLGARLPGTRLRHVISRDDVKRVAVIEAETVAPTGKAGLRGTVTVSLREKAAKETVVKLDTNLKLGAAAASMGASRASAFGSQFVGNLSQNLADQARRRTRTANATAPAEPPVDAGDVRFRVTTPPGNLAAGGVRVEKVPATEEPRPKREQTRQDTGEPAAAAGPGNPASGTEGLHETLGRHSTGDTVKTGAGRAREALRNPQVAGAVGLAAGAIVSMAARRGRS